MWKASWSRIFHLIGRVIASHHDFSGGRAIYNRSTNALPKHRARFEDFRPGARHRRLHPVFQLIDRARRERRQMIAIGMGNAGIATRILGPSRGAFLTYGALDDDSATAPGQVNAPKLRSLYHIDQIDDETMICGLIGLPVMHSVSPHIHNAAFAAENQWRLSSV